MSSYEYYLASRVLSIAPILFILSTVLSVVLLIQPLIRAVVVDSIMTFSHLFEKY